MTKKVLLVGESWVSSATHYKGFDQFGSRLGSLRTNAVEFAAKVAA